MPEYAVNYDRMSEYYGQQSEEMMSYVRKVQALIREIEPR
jgi:hypothetical protein